MDIKICGARSATDITALENAGATYAGLWSGIDGHPNDLPDADFRKLVNACRQVIPIAVCVRKPVPALLDLLAGTGVRHVQLHGFNPPGDVWALKQAGCQVIKTLHVSADGFCPEARWLGAYTDAGVDIFLLDRFDSATRIGSTGHALPDQVLTNWTGRLFGHRIWLAGGLTAERLPALAAQSRIETVDIDSAARNDSLICVHAVRALVQAVLDPAPINERASA